jgi:hypothetical protein
MAEEQEQNELNSRISPSENALTQQVLQMKQREQSVDTQRQLRSSNNSNNNQKLYLLRHSTRTEKPSYSLS